MKQYLQLLQQENVLQKLSLIQLISYFGAWFSNVAIYTLLIQINVDPAVIAFVAMLHFLSGTLQAPLSGAIIDRLQPKKLLLTLIAMQIVATFGMLGVQTQEDLFLLYFLIFIKMAAASFYFTAEMSILPRILDGEKLKLANELHSMIWSFSYTLGMALSGYFVYLFGVKMAFLVDAFLFVIAFLILLKTPLLLEVHQKTQKLLYMIQEAFWYLKKDTKVLHLMLIHAFVGFTAFDALIALLVDNFYKTIIATSLALGLMHSFRAFGLVVGPMVLSKWINQKNLFYLFVLEAVVILLWSVFIENFYVSLFLSIFVGFFTTTLWSYTYTLIQKNMDPAFYGRVIAYNDMFFLGVSAFASFMIGFLAQNGVSLHIVALLLGVMFLVGALYYKLIQNKYHLKG